MKKFLLSFIFILSTIIVTHSQIKAGDNPFDINEASLLELESRDKVFVVTRISNEEMNAIIPLNGALVYNTDIDCLFQFRNNTWNSLCAPGETITFLADNNNGTFSYINENGEETIIEKASLIDNQDGTFTFDNGNGIPLTLNIATLETTTSIVDNNDGSFTYNDEDGNATTINKSDITDNMDGTYTFTNNDGSDVVIDANGLDINNVIGGNRIATFTDGAGTAVDVDETITTVTNPNTATTTNRIGTYTNEDPAATPVDILETVTSISDNNDGTITYTPEAGAAVTISKSDITDNMDGTYTFTNNDGSDVVIDANGLDISNVIGGNRIATFTDGAGTAVDVDETITTVTNPNTATTTNRIGTYTNEDPAATPVDILETVTSISDNNDGTITYTPEAGAAVTISKSDITDNMDGTYTFTNNDGSDVVIDANGLDISNVIGGNRIATFTDGAGTAVDVDETITTVTNPNTATTTNRIGTYTNEDPAATPVDILETVTSISDNNDGTITYTPEAGAAVTISKSDITDNMDGTYTFTNNDGSDVVIDANGLDISNVIGGNRIATFTDGAGTAVDVDETITTVTNPNTATTTNRIGTYTNEDPAATPVDILETVTSISDNNDGTITYTPEAGAAVTISKSDITDNMDGTYTFTNNDGSDVVIDANGLDISNVIGGNRIATFTDGAGTAVDVDETITTMTNPNTATTTNRIGTYTNEDPAATPVDILETVTSISDNNDGTITYTPEAGAAVTISKSDITDNMDGTYTFTNNDGSDVVIDANGLDISNVIGGNRIATFTDGAGTAVDVDETITTVTNPNTAITTNRIGTYTNEDPAATPVDILETVTSISDNNDGTITYTPEAGAAVTISKSDITDNMDGTYTFTNNDGSDVVIDANGLDISNVIGGNRIATFTDGAGTAVDVDETITTVTNPNTATTTNRIGTYTNEDPAATPVDILETVTSISDNNNGTITYTPEAGAAVTISKSDITDNMDGTYTFTNNDGSDVVIDANGLDISNVIGGNRIATFTDGAGTAVDVDETITTVTNPNTATTTNRIGTYTNEDPAATPVDILETVTSITQQIGNENTDVTAGDANTIASYADETGTSIAINETVTSLGLGADNESLDYDDENGVTNNIDLSGLIHTGTPGSVFFAGTDGRLNENNAQLFYDEVNTRLFLGPRLTSNINNELNVNGSTRTGGLNNANGTVGLPSYRFTSDSDTGL